MDIKIISAFVLYFTTLFTIAFTFYRKSRSERSFVLGNRSLNYWVTAISTQASDMGTWLFLSYPAIIYQYGLIEAWTGIGLVFCMWLNWQFIAPRLRKLTAQYKSLTLWTFFEHRFQDSTSRIRIISASISLFYFIIYIATAFMGVGRLLEANFGTPYLGGIAIGALLTCSYILIGGFLAAAWCNLFQGLFLLSMITIVPLVAYFHIGGFSAIIQAARAQEISLHLFQSWNDIILMLFTAVGGWGIGYFGQPHVLINFMGIDKESNIKKAKIVGISWQLIALSSSIFIGLTGMAMFNQLPIAEHLFPLMVKQLFGPFMIGLILCGVLAAILSTVTLQILVVASSTAEDLYKTIINPNISSKHITLVTRISIIIITLLSIATAYLSHTSIYRLVWFAWSGLGSAFGPLILMSLYSKKINSHGAVAAIISGGVAAIITPLLTKNIPALAIGFTTSLICAYIVSFMTQKKEARTKSA